MKMKRNNPESPPRLSFSKHNIEIMGTWNLWEQALCYKEVQGFFEESLLFGKRLQMPN